MGIPQNLHYQDACINLILTFSKEYAIKSMSGRLVMDSHFYIVPASFESRICNRYRATRTLHQESKNESVSMQYRARTKHGQRRLGEAACLLLLH